MKVSLEPIRTDGWFERIGERVGSFQALCEILGERFFAFSLITGARVTALTVDRRNPDESLVDFEVSGAELGADQREQRLTLQRFRQRLVSALLAEENYGPPPKRDTDVEAIQAHVGVRYLLLAPLYGFSLTELEVGPGGSRIKTRIDGEECELTLADFRQGLRALVLDELDRVQRSQESRNSIDLATIPEAQAAADKKDHARVVELLGNWAMPLTFLLRTPDGQALNDETRILLASALQLLGEAQIASGEEASGEEMLRLAVQYCVDTDGAGSAYHKLGAALFGLKRFGEAIAPLRRAANLNAPAEKVWPLLAVAFLERNRLLAAWGATEEARASGVVDPRIAAVRGLVLRRLPALERWESWTAP
jgi:tetratricopeptide (TPR) repeat protein